MLTGKDALSVSTKVDITNLSLFLKNCLIKYDSKVYQKKFKWIDQIEHIKDEGLVIELDAKLISDINSNSDIAQLMIPDFIDWENHKGFKYSTNKKDKLIDEIDLADWLLTKESVITIEDLKQNVVTAWGGSGSDNDQIEERWSVYRCLYAEIKYKSRTYFLSDSKWYFVDSDFVKAVNDDISKIKWVNLGLPDFDHASENEYNRHVAPLVNGEIFDAQNLNYGGGYSKIEFCDIITYNKELLHVKKYSGSAVLSHLFNQGHVSAELMLIDERFREALRLIMPTRAKILVPKAKIDATKYHIVFVIIHKNPVGGKFELPFFSKIALRRIYRLLKAYRYNVSLCAVKNNKV